jgi:Ca-activated chloride channel family protein
MHIAYPHNVAWLLAVAGLVCLAVLALARRFTALRRLGVQDTRARGRFWSVSKALARCTAAVLIGIAILGPCLGERVLPTPLAQGRDLFVLLDVSRSMLTEDAGPNRLGQAKTIVHELTAALERYGGYRVGLVAFAERPVLLCPLTCDFRHLREELKSADLQSVRLRESRQTAGSGSDLQLALERVLRLLPSKEDAAGSSLCVDVLLISDGGDANDAALHAAAEALKARRVAVHTLGVGDSTKDSPIPVRLASGGRDLLRFEGELVRTRLQEEPLREIATRTGGAYVPAGRGVGAVLDELTSKETRELRAETQATAPIHRFQWFLLPAVFLLVFENLLGARRKASAPQKAARRAAWLTRLVPPPRARVAPKLQPATQA